MEDLPNLTRIPENRGSKNPHLSGMGPVERDTNGMIEYSAYHDVTGKELGITGLGKG